MSQSIKLWQYRFHIFMRFSFLSVVMLLVTVAKAGVDNESSLPVLDENAPIEHYLRYAALNNAGLEVAFNNWKAALEKITQARTLPDPKFNYGYFIEAVETRVGPQEQKFGLAQTFPWFGKLKLRADVATEAANATEAIYNKTKLNLFYRVKSVYAEYWYLGRAIDVTKEHKQLLSNMENIARTRYKTGKAPYSSVVQMQVELGQLEDKLSTLTSLRQPIMAKLNSELNRSTNLPLPWPKQIPALVGSVTDKEALENMAMKNPELKNLEYLEKSADANIKLAKKLYYPDFTLGVDYVQTGGAVNADVADNGKDPVIAMVSVNIPIWIKKYRAAGEEARLRKLAIKDTHLNTKNRLDADVKMSLYYYHDAERKINLYRDTLVPKAKQALEAAQQEFRAGTTGYISFIDTERRLLEFQLSAERAQADRYIRFAEVEKLAGTGL